MQEAEGWPGHLWLEGATLVHLPTEQPRPGVRPRGPAKRIGPGFLNPAMAPARTRSVMLLADALEHDWLVPEGAPIRVLDALCSTGVRVRRWRQERRAAGMSGSHLSKDFFELMCARVARRARETACATHAPAPRRTPGPARGRYY